MDIEDKELFDSATNDEPIEVVADEPVAEPVNDGQPRDDQGRFAAKAEEPAVAEPVATEPQGKEEAYVPSWRLREMREEREAVERRFQETQQQWQRQIAELQAKLPKAEPAKAPDVFEDPNAFLQHGVQQAVDPINSKVTSLVESFSKKWAIKEHGQEKVDAAYAWVKEGMQTRDPEVMAVYQRAMAVRWTLTGISLVASEADRLQQDWQRSQRVVREGAREKRWPIRSSAQHSCREYSPAFVLQAPRTKSNSRRRSAKCPHLIPRPMTWVT
jgi:HAMP domain-containing protein